jgi:hypothetical protein
MASYYCLMAGLPELSLTSQTPVMTVRQFKEQLDEVLTDSDRALLHYYFLQYDCRNLLALLKNPEAETNQKGDFTHEQYLDLITSAREMNFNVHRFPAFMSEFARNYSFNKDKSGYFPDDALGFDYLAYAMQCPNRVMREWYERMLHVTNILTALIARKNGWGVSDYIQGDNEVNEMIRENNTHDFGLRNEYDYMVDLLKIVDVEDPVEKERKLDALKWMWLDEIEEKDIFSIEAVFVYLVKLEILERWSVLDVENGKRIFREIIENLRGEARVPDEFKK